jgi:hypothetical protein
MRIVLDTSANHEQPESSVSAKANLEKVVTRNSMRVLTLIGLMTDMGGYLS